MLSLNTFGAEKKLKAAGCKTEAILMDEICSNYPAAKIKPSKTGNKKGLILFAEGKTDFDLTCKPADYLIKKFKLNPELIPQETLTRSSCNTLPTPTKPEPQ